MTIKNYLLAFFLCLAITPLNAQTKLRDNIYTKTLSNGLTVLVVEDDVVPLVTINMVFKNGSFAETPKYSGVTSLYHHMLFKATEGIGDRDRVMYTASVLGMRLNAGVNEEQAKCFFTMPAMGVDAGLAYMNSTMRFPLLSQAELEKAKSVSESELQGKESNPAFKLNEESWKRMWGDMDNRKRAIGNHQSINSATLDLIDSVRKRYYQPNNALLIVAGKVSHDQIFSKVESLFSSWQAPPFDPFKKWPIPAFKSLQKTDYYTVETTTATVPLIMIKWRGPDTRTDMPATYVADVFSYILTQNSSKLNKALVQSGLALSTNFNYLTLKYGGEITFIIQPNPQKIKECLAEVQRQIRMFDADDYLTSTQIETAKRKLEINQIKQEDVTSEFVHSLSFWWASASLNYYFNYLDNLKKINKADLQAYVRKYIKNKPYSAGLLINPQLKTQSNTDTFFKAPTQP